MNDVDTAQSSVDKDWLAMASDEGFDINESQESIVEGEESQSFVPGTVEQPKEDPQAKIDAATAVIKSALKFSITTMSKVEISDREYEAFAHPLAVVICKHYDGGIIQFLNAWSEEITLTGAAIVFSKSVVTGIRVKRAKVVKEKEVAKRDDSNDE